jgi:hypothetical protein
MDHNDTWDNVAARLRGTDTLTVWQYEVGAGATEDDLEVIKLMEVSPPPPSILQFFLASNGVKLLWNGTVDDQPVQGSINIVTLVESALRTPAQEEGLPLEGILWNDEFAPQIIENLKRMAIFEAIAGRSDYLTYRVDEANARLFLVQNDKIRPIIPDFETTIGLLMRYAGADSLREHLTYEDWSDRISTDITLQRIAML